MFERFSQSYYLGRLYVRPSKSASPTMSRRQQYTVRNQLYGDHKTEREFDGEVDEHDEIQPLVMKLGSRHFPVTGAESVPHDTLAVPPNVLADTPIENPPALQEVLLATEDRAAQLLSIAGASRNDPTGI